MKPIELLAPAGSPEALDAAIAEGADAVYLGLKNFNARMRSANFAYSQFEGALRSLHGMGRKLYVTVNTVFEQREADRMYQLLKYLADLGPDGLIVQDFGVAAMVRECFPSLKLHASTQMNIAGARGVNALSRHGFSRVVLARELSLEELRECRANTNMELEYFVHGALCVSASGLCLFSSYLGGKSANRGMCTQACRRYYRRHETEEGGYYFSPNDLQLIRRVPELADAGVNSFKIEGRMKSAEYVGTVVSAYRLVLDALAAGEDEDTVHRKIEDAAAILRNDFARSKTEFYFVGNAGHDGEAGVSIDWLNPAQDGGTGIPLGAILKARGSGAERRGLVSPGPVLPKPGDSVRIHSAEDKERQSHKITAVESDGSTGLWISIPEGVESGDGVYLTQTKAMTKRYPQIATGHHHSRREPGHDKAPVPEVAFGRSKTVSRGKAARDLLFPEGLYVAVSRIEDLYVLQSARPLRVMLALTRRTLAKLLEKGRPPLPFNKGELILTLDPYFPQGDEAYMGEAIETLLDEGYRQFVVNNPGHFSYFRGASNGSDAVGLIAGPYLYTFNRWALSFVSSLGADYVVSPLENNRQNLEKTLDSACRSHAFVTIFAWPALFRIRANLGTKYRFNRFSDSRGEEFLLNSGDEGSIVYPERPFSIVDKVPFLQTAGFSRFILDLSGGKALKKAHYRDLIKSVREVVPLPDISRFNWKDGFFQQES